jgi:hypothetical protein
MTGILRFENSTNPIDGLILTSLAQKGNKGDEGIYYVTNWFTIRLPLNEYFHVWIHHSSQSIIKAKHQMWMCGIKFLSIDYIIKRNK